MVRWQGPYYERGENDVVVVEGSEEMISRRATLFLSMGSFILSLMFFSQNITGNVVANFSTNGANWIGGMFFVLAVIGFLVYTQKKKGQKRKKKKKS